MWSVPLANVVTTIMTGSPMVGGPYVASAINLFCLQIFMGPRPRITYRHRIVTTGASKHIGAPLMENRERKDGDTDLRGRDVARYQSS